MLSFFLARFQWVTLLWEELLDNPSLLAATTVQYETENISVNGASCTNVGASRA